MLNGGIDGITDAVEVQDPNNQNMHNALGEMLAIAHHFPFIVYLIHYDAESEFFSEIL